MTAFRSIRSGLMELLNDLGTIERVHEEANVALGTRRLRQALRGLLADVLRQGVERHTTEYRAALTRLKVAERAAKKAIVDVRKVRDAIGHARKAAKAVERVLGFAGVMMGSARPEMRWCLECKRYVSGRRCPCCGRQVAGS